MINPVVSNPNDFKVVDFTNKTDFDFTPEMGCMFDSRPIFGTSGSQGIKAGESIKLPYHIGHRLAVNLAKAVMTRKAPVKDPDGVPTGVPLWDETALRNLKNTFIADLYTEAKPIAETEVDRLMKKVAELNKLVMENIKTAPTKVVEPSAEGNIKASADPSVNTQPAAKKVFLDKQEVIAELTKRNITFDARASKEDLEKLVA